MTDHYDGDDRALPIVQAIVGVAETERGRPVEPLPDPVRACPTMPARRFRQLVETEQLEPAQALLRGAIHAGAERRRPARLGSPMSSAITSSRTATARSTCRRRSNSSTASAGIAPTRCCRTSCRRIVYGTREDKLPVRAAVPAWAAPARPRRARRGGVHAGSALGRRRPAARCAAAAATAPRPRSPPVRPSAVGPASSVCWTR